MALITPAGLLYLGYANFYDEIGHHKTHTTSDAMSPSLPHHTIYDETQSEVDPTWHTFMMKYVVINSACLDGHVAPAVTNFLSSMTKVYVIGMPSVTMPRIRHKPSPAHVIIERSIFVINGHTDIQ